MWHAHSHYFRVFYFVWTCQDMSQTCHNTSNKEYKVNSTCHTCHKPFYNNEVYTLILQKVLWPVWQVNYQVKMLQV